MPSYAGVKIAQLGLLAGDADREIAPSDLELVPERPYSVARKGQESYSASDCTYGCLMHIFSCYH